MAKQTNYRGCLLGLAVGDAMGYAVDDRSLEQIRADYGPEGLLGFDLLNGYADVSSYTQLAVYAANGLLLGLTRGQMQGVMAPYVRYIALAEREWAQTQRYSGNAERSVCWVSREREFRGRRCMDTRMLDTLSRGRPGSLEEPVNRFVSPGAMTVAVPVGMFFNPLRMDRAEIDRLGAEAVALTHGAPQAFLVGAALAHMISRIIWDSVDDLKELVKETVETLQESFGREYRQVAEVRDSLNMALRLADSHNVSCSEAMEHLHCTTMSFSAMKEIVSGRTMHFTPLDAKARAPTEVTPSGIRIVSAACVFRKDSAVISVSPAGRAIVDAANAGRQNRQRTNVESRTERRFAVMVIFLSD